MATNFTNLKSKMPLIREIRGKYCLFHLVDPIDRHELMQIKG